MHIMKMGIAAALSACLLAAPAHAEKADRDKPVNIEADTVTLDDIKKISVYSGNVILTQGTLMLRADRVQATQNATGLDKVSASGSPVTFRQKLDDSDVMIEGMSDRIEFDSASNQLELIGRAQLQRGGDELRGEQISYNSNTGFYKVVGQPNTPSPAGRVRATIMPKPRTDKPAAKP